MNYNFKRNIIKERFEIFLVLGIMLLLSTNAFADRKFKDPLDYPAVKSRLVTKSLFNGIAQAGNRTICVGQRGHIIYSDDNGVSWTQADVPVSSDLVAVSFPNEKNGWVVGHDGVVLHSSDGGKTWEKQVDGFDLTKIIEDYYGDAFEPQMANRVRFMRNIESYILDGVYKPLFDVWFEDNMSGCVIGAFNLIFRTQDGGKSWTPMMDRTDNPRNLHLYGMQKIGKELFVVGEQGVLLKWDPIYDRFAAIERPYQGSFFGLVGIEDIVLVYGLRGNLYRSEDTGLSWERIETGLEMSLVAATVTDDGRILIVSLDGTIIESSNLGKSFTVFQPDKSIHSATIGQASDGSLVIAGANGVRIVQR